MTTPKQKSDRGDAKKLAELLRLDGIQESYVPPSAIRTRRGLVRARKQFVEQRTKVKNEVTSLLDRAGVSTERSLFSEAGREQPAELDLSATRRFLLDCWLETIDEKLTRFDRRIASEAAQVEEVGYAMTAPGVAAYSGLMIHAELGENDRFDRAAKAVSYAGLDPVISESGETRREGGISKEGNGNLRWILYKSASTAVNNAKDPYLGEFYHRLRDTQKKSHKAAMVATARKLLVSLFHMMQNKEVYQPAGHST